MKSSTKAGLSHNSYVELTLLYEPMKLTINKKCIFAFYIALTTMGLVGCHDVNCLPDSHFTDDGYLKDSIDSSMVMKMPSEVKFFMEASGSMNGLYRPGCQTEFRDDVYQIVSYYLKSDNDLVYTLCSDNGKSGFQMTLRDFANAIKVQGFPTMGTTSITDMIETVVSNIDTLKNQVGVLISDMKFDPNGKNNIAYQLGMYTTKVSHITSESNLAFSLVAATSKYYDNQGGVLADKSPYYYLIMGKSENVAKVRDDISTMLNENDNFADNIETGMNYGGVNFELEKVRNCMKMSKQPTFTGVAADSPCRIKLKLHLENYRWLMSNEEAVRSTFEYKMIHGSKVAIDSIQIDSLYKDSDHRLNRTMIASIHMSISDLQADCDVLEWSFNPCKIDGAIGGFNLFFGADNWKQFNKTYSIENFLQGFFRGAHLSSCSKKPNYVLISTH